MDILQQLTEAESWEQRYRLIIRAGKNLPVPEERELAAMEKIAGCEAAVWFAWYREENNRTFVFRAYSESRIINGLLWLILQEVNHKDRLQLRHFSISDYFSSLGIAQRLSNTRLNGLKQIEKIINGLE
ncbi:SufE family protein [Mesocricetibacter intestinalis]|uniref:SufE family protein n=1 Tax=Mesocricetibacter intestinalis TaxID=1521930 RepID=UPI0010622C57|nr:SufE family protein [Mesocricetibacter intestinalis]